MFSFIKKSLKKVYSQFTQKVHVLFSRSSIDEATLKELEILLLSSDTGTQTTKNLITALRAAWQRGSLKEGKDLHAMLQEQLLHLLESKQSKKECSVYLLVGINGSGKTTFAAKLAHKLTQEGKKPLLVAADTFRAAATEQLATWAERTNTALVIGKQDQDPASVVFAGCQRYKDEQFDALIIDTAGRLQTKANLMRELEKIKKIITKQLPDASINTLLTIDAMLGQNSKEQAKVFNESTQVDGIILTKMDGTGKGGIVFALMQELHIPIAYISYGEQLDQCKLFDAHDYVQELLNDSK